MTIISNPIFISVVIIIGFGVGGFLIGYGVRGMIERSKDDAKRGNSE